MSKKIHVVGHRNPDTDSICAAIAYARLKQRLGMDHVIPYRAGKINRETEFVLNAFGVEAPELLKDLHLRVKDMLNGPIPAVKPRTSLLEAWKIMKESNQKTLPVVDHTEQMIGMITVGDLSGSYIESMADHELESLHIPVENVIRTLNGRLLVGSAEQDLKGNVYVGAMRHETLEAYVGNGNIVLMGDRQTAQESVLRQGVSALILTGGATLAPELEDLARQQNCVVISVPYDTFTAARLLPMTAPVQNAMKTEGIVAFNEDDLISEVKEKMLETRFRNYPVLDEQGKVVGLISRYHLLSLSRKQVILVDHNEFGQAVVGTDQAQILEVVDHHRVGGIQTGEPILFRNEPVGSTCTIVAKCYRDWDVVPEKAIAGIMLGAILSDTVIFKSPTCTEIDRENATYLASIAGVDPKEFGVQMFKAASNLGERQVDELIEEDLKEFTMGELRVGIGQFSVMGLEGLDQLRAELSQRMEEIRGQRAMNYLMLMVTDLLEENTELFISGAKPEEIAKAFDKPLDKESIFLPGVLSRKKQVVPPLSKYFLQ
ncbi:Cobalt-dependent inorganic pyrophosphatase [bioreactor metagenome]|uniref:inorganic diphosphatase n=1 Tax=bioreactor metagenome TaxID=1076179 RepID=A0A644UCM6_9ZZZZ|nr:putative manganese-dependent inorganic diphosphatase [Desulfitobacterium hafniense]MEA5023507.1 putative manganese-dependent inorganic diphosphatase [Desulfitobacterium hafniense]